jgi:hypothetical protein
MVWIVRLLTVLLALGLPHSDASSTTATTHDSVGSHTSGGDNETIIEGFMQWCVDSTLTHNTLLDQHACVGLGSCAPCNAAQCVLYAVTMQ